MSNLMDTSMDDDFHEGEGNNNQTTQQQKIKVIIPPPEIKTVIDKTAAYVAKNGASFESLIMKVEASNPKFNFLRYHDDPYRPYYIQKINEHQGIKIEDADKAANATENNDQVEENGHEQEHVNGEVLQNGIDGQAQVHVPPVSAVQQSIVVQRENEYQRQLRQLIFGDIEDKKRELRPPQADQFSISHPVLANIDQDVIKLTAQFVARNGQKFLQGLTEREARNPQFDFLKPTHGLFGYFTQLVESYSKVLIPRNEQLQRLQKFSQDGLEVLKSAGERYLWDKLQDEEQKKRADQQDTSVRDEEQMQIDTIDWHDFVVVEKIDLYDDEEMKAQEEAEIEELKEQERVKEQIKKQIEENQQIMSMPPDGLAPPIKEKAQVNLPPVNQVKHETQTEIVVSNALDSEMKIKKNYQRKDDKVGGAVGTQKCPKCQQEIPINQWSEHMRLELMDPKWREEKLKREERAKLNSLADGDEIAQNLRRFTQERRDIFPNAGQHQQIQSDQPQLTAGQKIIWDGQAQNITRTTANIAMLQHQQQKNLQEALQTRGQLDPKSMVKLNQSQNPVPTVKNLQNAILTKEQLMQKQQQQQKRQIEDDEDEALNVLQGQLRSEAEWLRLFPGKISLSIRIPNNPNEPQWNMKGQLIPLSVDSRVTIAQLKENMSQILGNLPPQIIRLRGQKSLPMKDSLTLAFYNIPDGATIDLALKSQAK